MIPPLVIIHISAIEGYYEVIIPLCGYGLNT